MSAGGPQSAARVVHTGIAPGTRVAYGGSGDRTDHEGPDALQALLADPKLLKLLRTAIADPGQFERRGGKGAEPVEAWQARAVRTALRRVSDG